MFLYMIKQMHLTSVAHKNLNKIDIEYFSVFKKVYSGHIHIVQRNKNFTFVGSNFQMDRNDMGDQKGIFILDPHNGDEEFIENKVSPVFKKIYVRTQEDVLSLYDIEDDSNSEEEQKYDISISLDYEDYIKEYISKQKIDNDKFKSGLMEEYDKVIEIYKEEFKNKIK